MHDHLATTGDQLLGGESSDTGPSPQILAAHALWILKVKECRMLTQSTTEGILSDVTELCTSITQQMGQTVSSLLQSAGVNPADIPGLEDVFAEDSSFAQPFAGIGSQYLQMSYYRTHLNYVVSIYML